MAKVILFETDKGLAIMTPAPKFLETLDGTEDEKLQYVANKDLPTGTAFQIVDISELPHDIDPDHQFRDAWEYDGEYTETSEDLTAEQLAVHNMKENK